MDAIYARQSVDKKDSLSIEGQIDLCRKYTGDTVQVYQDKGFSGKSIKRPAFTELVQAIRAGAVQKVFVYRLDRFSRSIADFSRLWEMFERYRVEFQSVTEHFDTSSPIGRAMLYIVLVFAQLERETTAERVRDNYLHRFALGSWPGGPAPYGFDLIKITQEGRRVSSLTPNPNAKTVQTIFETYAQPETSLRSLARSLAQQGIHGPRREMWDNVTLSRLLHSPVYVRADEEVYWYYHAKGLPIQQGLDAFDGVHACNMIGRRNREKNEVNRTQRQQLAVANHEGFISSALWLRVQEKLEDNLQMPKVNAGKYSWLTGLMKCAKCGYSIKINRGRGADQFYLLCAGRSNLANCDAKIGLDLREIETAVADQMQSVLWASVPDCPQPDDQEAAAKILALDQKIQRLVDALAESGTVSARYVAQKIEVLDRERAELLHRSSVPSDPVSGIDFAALTFSEKKLVAREFIDRILLGEQEINIVWKF